MSEYYFFDEVKKVFEIEKWFKRSFSEIVYLEHTAPVTFTIDRVTYAVRYTEKENLIYTIKLYGSDGDIKSYHKTIRKRVEKFLNILKDIE